MNNWHSGHKAQQLSTNQNDHPDTELAGCCSQSTSSRLNCDLLVPPVQFQGQPRPGFSTPAVANSSSVFSDLTSAESLTDFFEGLEAKVNQSLQGIPRQVPLPAPLSTVTKTKRRGKRANNDVLDALTCSGWKCVQCGAREADTPVKRKGPDKTRNYCNACYVRWRVKVERSERGSARPVFASASSLLAASDPSLGIPFIPPTGAVALKSASNLRSSSSALAPFQPTLSLSTPTNLLGIPTLQSSALFSQPSPTTSTEKATGFWTQSPLFPPFNWDAVGSFTPIDTFPDLLRDSRPDPICTSSIPIATQYPSQPKPYLFAPPLNMGPSQSLPLQNPNYRRDSGFDEFELLSLDSSWLNADPLGAFGSTSQAVPNQLPLSLPQATALYPETNHQPAQFLASQLGDGLVWNLKEPQSDLQIFNGGTANVNYSQALGFGSHVVNGINANGNGFPGFQGFAGSNSVGGEASFQLTNQRAPLNYYQMFQNESVGQLLSREDC
ncbi:hypothetical protein BJ741DRAFT_577903 [Chytriomyces cf. hyalinus JEL632]|nr:hypothetical protein BJ741DRAFT_577903 [Chytriomyces cf. hyalinus JEL632]